MPGVRFWFICGRAFVVAFAGIVTAQLVQLAGTTTGIAGTTWLVAVLGGLTAACNAGHVAWPETPAPVPQPDPARPARPQAPPAAWPPPIPPVTPPAPPQEGGTYEA